MPPPWIEQDAQRRRREEARLEQQRAHDVENLELQRRSTAALEQSLGEERGRNRELQIDRLAALTRELEARRGEYQWRVLSALLALAALVVSGIGVLWGIPSFLP